jgi:hypothetical protein
MQFQLQLSENKRKEIICVIRQYPPRDKSNTYATWAL